MSKPGSQWVHHTTCCQPISSVVLQVVDQTSQTLIRHDDHQLSADTSRNPIFTTTNELHYARVSHCGKCQHVSLVGIATTLCHCQYLTHHTDDTESRHSLDDTVPLSVSDTPYRWHGVTTQSQCHNPPSSFKLQIWIKYYLLHTSHYGLIWSRQTSVLHFVNTGWLTHWLHNA